MDARIFAAAGIAICFIGFVTSICIWIEKQQITAVSIGFILMALGCMIFSIGQFDGEYKKQAAKYFTLISVWLLSLMPISCIFNGIQGIIGGFSWSLSPLPQLGNSMTAYAMCWLFYVVFCVAVDYMVFAKSRKTIRE